MEVFMKNQDVSRFHVDILTQLPIILAVSWDVILFNYGFKG